MYKEYSRCSHSKMWSVYDDPCVHKGNSLHSHTNTVTYTPLTLTQLRLACTLNRKCQCNLIFSSIHHSNHRVHIEWQLPISGVHSWMEKSTLACAGGGHARPPPFNQVQSCSTRSGQKHSPYFISTLYELCGVHPSLDAGKIRKDLNVFSGFRNNFKIHRRLSENWNKLSRFQSGLSELVSVF